MIEQALDRNYIVIIATSSKDDAILKKIMMLKNNIKDKSNTDNLLLIQGDKVNRICNFLNQNDISMSSMAYIGDSENDMVFIGNELVGLRGCPSDAIKEVKNKCDVISSLEGGKGAVYEFIKFLIMGKKE